MVQFAWTGQPQRREMQDVEEERDAPERGHEFGRRRAKDRAGLPPLQQGERREQGRERGGEPGKIGRVFRPREKGVREDAVVAARGADAEEPRDEKRDREEARDAEPGARPALD